MLALYVHHIELVIVQALHRNNPHLTMKKPMGHVAHMKIRSNEWTHFAQNYNHTISLANTKQNRNIFFENWNGPSFKKKKKKNKKKTKTKNKNKNRDFRILKNALLIKSWVDIVQLDLEMILKVRQYSTTGSVLTKRGIKHPFMGHKFENEGHALFQG